METVELDLRGLRVSKKAREDIYNRKKRAKFYSFLDTHKSRVLTKSRGGENKLPKKKEQMEERLD